ncbi:MAG: electron transfer flavoprotein subunit alpha/FixB family protein [Thermoprotei archaeon]|nr:MAG: electron transfer flavoprotein subunit alpha/FixB family protein [Thermoprotei archaeon]RLF18501.1 MAG: electron transfer flavoprotein subunit alpha/FixB family protein [Thermoprotei archaeon]
MNPELLALAEHREGELREVTFELAGLARKLELKATCVLLGFKAQSMAEKLASYFDEVFYVEHDLLKHFNSDLYQPLLAKLTKERRPKLVAMGHTSIGMELAPSLAAELGCPLITDVLDVQLNGEKLLARRQIYGGKVEALMELKESPCHMITMRPGVLRQPEPKGQGKVTKVDMELKESLRKKVVGYVEPPVAEVDITKADVIVSIGRGIRDAGNIPAVEELARMLGGVLACSRPVVDKGWLPKDRQVGNSGKTVKPKLYLALGISGAFQHVVGMKNSDLIIAVNKDPNAPIFNVAHYGIVDDLMKVVEALKNLLKARS